MRKVQEQIAEGLVAYDVKLLSDGPASPQHWVVTFSTGLQTNCLVFHSKQEATEAWEQLMATARGALAEKDDVF